MPDSKNIKRIYLDYAATTPVHPSVSKAVNPFFSRIFGNPSAVHYHGRKARQAMDSSREKVARFIGVESDCLFFTSGGTEANNLALSGIAHANRNKGNHIITSAIEHHAVLEVCHSLEGSGFQVTYLPVDKFGIISPEDVENAITDKTILISVMLANNVIGTIQPISEIGKIARKKGVYLHTDAVQAAGHIPVSVDDLGVDILSMSAHKLYGPKGIGALYIKKGTRIAPILYGGGQENRMRSGTENVPCIVGFGRAAELASEEMKQENERVIKLRDNLIKNTLSSVPFSHLNGHSEKRLPNNSNFSFEFIEGEWLCSRLDDRGISASTGSACSSASHAPSYVLKEIGRSPELCHGSLRLTLGKWTTDEEINHILNVLPEVIAGIRSSSPLYKKHLKQS